MDQRTPSQAMVRKYQGMGFAWHLIIEAWHGYQGREDLFMDILLKIHSRDQLHSEQRLAWDGKRAQITRIVNQAKLTKFSRGNYLQRKTLREFQELRKKGLLLKKEFRGSRGLNLEYKCAKWFVDKDIHIIAKEMKGYLRRLRHLSIKFDFRLGSKVNIVPLLKSIRRKFAGLVSLNLSLRKVFRLEEEDLSGFHRLFAWLRPTLRHLNLDFAENSKSAFNFTEALGKIIKKNLHKLEVLSLDFTNTQFPITLVRLFINSAYPRMTHLRSLSLTMKNCFVAHDYYIRKAATPSNLRYLKLNFDDCANLEPLYLLSLQHHILIACPGLEELDITLPNYKRFSGEFLSKMREEFLQKLNLKRLRIESPHELEEPWNYYQNILASERAEEKEFEDFICGIKQKAGGGEEELGLYLETLIGEEELQYYYIILTEGEGDVFEFMNDEDRGICELQGYEEGAMIEQDSTEQEIRCWEEHRDQPEEYKYESLYEEERVFLWDVDRMVDDFNRALSEEQAAEDNAEEEMKRSGNDFL